MSIPDKLALITNVAASYLRRKSVSIDQIAPEAFTNVVASARIGVLNQRRLAVSGDYDGR